MSYPSTVINVCKFVSISVYKLVGEKKSLKLNNLYQLKSQSSESINIFVEIMSFSKFTLFFWFLHLLWDSSCHLFYRAPLMFQKCLGRNSFEICKYLLGTLVSWKLAICGFSLKENQIKHSWHGKQKPSWGQYF